MPISLVAMTVAPLAVYSEVQVQVSSIALVHFNVIIDTRSRRTRALLQMKCSANLLRAVFALQSQTDHNLDFCANHALTSSFGALPLQSLLVCLLRAIPTLLAVARELLANG